MEKGVEVGTSRVDYWWRGNEEWSAVNERERKRERQRREGEEDLKLR